MLTDTLFHPLGPAASIPNDWYRGSIPANISVGENSVIDSAATFKHFFSQRAPGLIVGNNVTLCRASLATETNGLIEIGDYCYLSNAALVCSERISVGSHVFIAAGVTIADSDFHPIAPAARLADTLATSPLGNHQHRPKVASKPIIIENGVWIGFNATVMKGVRIGENAVIEAGAVVISDVPAGCTVAGNPAKPVEQL
jgi:acetyltransferase-like isoleucine patch superfamily enzyme